MIHNLGLKSPVDLYCESNNCTFNADLDSVFNITTGGCDMFAISTQNIEKCLLTDDIAICLEENVEDEKIDCEAFTYNFEGTGSIDDSIMSS